MAVTVGRCQSYNGGLATITGIVVDPGDDRVLLVATGVASTSRRVTGITYAGQPLTLIAAAPDISGADGTKLWALVNPPVGTANLVPTKTSSSANVVLLTANVTGVDQAAPFGTPAAQTVEVANTQPSITVPSAAGELVVDALYARGKPLTPEAGQTEHGEVSYSTNPHTIGLSSKPGEPGTTTMAWTVAGSFRWQSQVGVALKPSGPVVADATADLPASIGTGDSPALASAGGAQADVPLTTAA